MTVLNLIVLSLAVYRVARLAGWDSVTQRFRQKWTGWDDNGQKNNWPRNHKRIAEMIHCPFCFSAWLAVATWVAFRYYPHAILLVAWPLAIMAAAGLIGKQLDE